MHLNLSAHAKAQVLRFGRLFVLAGVPALLAASSGAGHWTIGVIAGIVVAAAETALRQMVKVAPVAPPEATQP